MIERKYLIKLYKIGIGIIFVLCIVALVSFIKAVSFKDKPPVIVQTNYADSVQFEVLKKEVVELQIRIDSLEKACQSKQKVVYKSTKRKKDSCVIELNIHNVDKE